MLRAKFKVDLIAKSVDGRNLSMSPVIGTDGDNQDWSKYTPTGHLGMFITNEAAFDAVDAIKPGDIFWIDIKPI